MYSLMLSIIYLAFTSLGLPDSLLGSAWPIMRQDLSVPLSYMGIIYMIVCSGTIISSLLSDRILRRFSTGVVTAVSVGMTMLALFGFSVAGNFYLICLIAIPYGLGAGAVDAALNNYVALHYSSKHMTWLHASWGVGVTISPYIMSYSLGTKYGWEGGYFSAGVIQLVITVILFAVLPIWKKTAEKRETEEDKPKVLTIRQALKLKGFPLMLVSFFCYCALEQTAIIWATSYLNGSRGVDPKTAASFGSMFCIGITVGRILLGFIADRLGDRSMIRAGCVVTLLGILLVGLPIESPLPAFIGLVVIGFGNSPIYPCIIHSTPDSFGRDNSQSLVGKQMAMAYFGNTLMPPLFGVLAQFTSLSLYPIYLAFFGVVMLVSHELMIKKVDAAKREAKTE
ncbi:MAG: MFS transporter [Clostridia bacterium]|nr:MFS transporter [Clostridia bacterium]